MTAPSARRGRADRPVVRLSGPGDVVEALPYLVGFVPQDSVVVVALAGSRHQVVLTARVDIAEDPVCALAPAWQAATAEGADSVLIVVFDDAAGGVPLPHAGVVGRLMAHARGHRLAVHDALCVGSARYWSYMCHEPACCPVEGRTVPIRGGVAAELVYSGQSVVGSREQLRAEFALDEVRARRIAALLPAAGHVGDRRWSVSEQIAYLDAWVDADDRLGRPDVDLVRAIRALQDVAVRDAQLLDRGAEGDRAAGQLWGGLAQVSPAPWRAVPLTLLAICAYRRGDGARANVAAEAAMAADAAYPLARLVAQALACAVSPRLLTEPLDQAARDRRSAAAGLRVADGGGGG